MIATKSENQWLTRPSAKFKVFKKSNGRYTNENSLTGMFNCTWGAKRAKTRVSTSSRGALSLWETLAAAKLAWESVECRWRYRELKVSSDSSSGTSLDTASTNTGPMGAGGDCGSEDAVQSKMSIVCKDRGWLNTSLPVCLRSTNRICNSGWSRFKEDAWFSAATAWRSFPAKSWLKMVNQRWMLRESLLRRIATSYMAIHTSMLFGARVLNGWRSL